MSSGERGMGFSKVLRADLFRYSGKDTTKDHLRSIFTHPGARFIFLFRMCNKYKKRHFLGLFFRLWIKFLKEERNIEIPHLTRIGSGLYCGHFQNIIINQNSQIGNNCNIMQGVTIGNESRGEFQGSPTIGDRVLIGPHSVVVGKIKVGNDVLIGPLTLVNFDVPDEAVVLGNPAQIISKKGSDGYINHVLS